jgi:hypothetical protein
MSNDAEKYQLYLAKQRERAKRYYETKLKPNDSMTESQKQKLADRKRIIAEKNKIKYAENREYYIEKSAENRRIRKAMALEQEMNE